MKNKTVPRFFLEFIIVLFSVLVAFSLNSWAESKREKKLEEFYLQSLQENLEADLRNIDTAIADQKRRLRSIELLIEQLRTPADFNKPLMDSLFVEKLGNTTFFPNEGAYKAMVSEGSLEIIRDKKLLTMIVELYEQQYLRNINFGKVLDNVVEKTTWQEKSYFSHYQLKLRDNADLRDTELLALQEHRFVFIQQYIYFCLETRKKLLEVIKTLERNR